jgi:dTDP-4-dehydrorhamnose 3,5-epimerase-like enzyme
MSTPNGLETVADVKLVELELHAREDGDLVVIQQGKSIPFAASRVFTVRATGGAVRGRHAHKRCVQFLVCVHGSIEVVCDDGTEKKTFVLDAVNKGLLVPASIWATETYVVAGSVLNVLCDRHYEAEDYIRDYDQFLAWRTNDG